MKSGFGFHVILVSLFLPPPPRCHVLAASWTPGGFSNHVSVQVVSALAATMPSGGQLFVRREDGSSLAIDVSAHGSLTVADVLLLVEVPFGPRLRAPHGCCLSNLAFCWALTAAQCMRATVRVQERTGDPANTQRLVYAGYQLAPERCIADYEVRCLSCTVPHPAPRSAPPVLPTHQATDRHALHVLRIVLPGA